MEGITKMIFGLMAIAVGSAVGLIAILGLVLGGWDTSGESGGVNLNLFGALIVAIAALIVTAGFRFWQHE